MKETETSRSSESGQATVLLVLVLGTFLFASLAFAVDFGNLWFHRQTAQTAADAACQAGAMDMLYLAQGTTLPRMGFTPGTSGDCTSSSGATMCWYANRNGFSGAGYTSTTAGSKVSWTFPAATSVTGVKAASVTNPFLKVTVQENIKTWFMGLLGKNYQAVAASCTCGLTPGPQNAPLVILHPSMAGALTSKGGTVIQILGGPQTSIQVDSSSQSAFQCVFSSPNVIDTSTAGPNGTGGSLNLAGGPIANPTCGGGPAMKVGTTGSWQGGVTSINQKTSDGTTMLNDIYKSVPAPNKPGAPTEATTPVDSYDHHQTGDGANGFDHGTWVNTGVDSCPNSNPTQYMWYSNNREPDHSAGDVWAECLEFTPGYYPSGIDLASIPGGDNATVIFMPGIYYLNGNLNVGGSSTVRNAWPATEPSTKGLLFYFLSGGPKFSGGSGASGISPVPTYYLNCSGTTTPGSLTGNVLVSQCSSGGTYVGSPSTDIYSASGTRGLLFFLAHSNVFNGTGLNAVIGQGASFNFSGAFYFHNSTNFQDKVEWNGAGVSATYAIGNIVVDQLILNGSGTIKMGLNGSTSGGPPLVGLFQ